MLSDGSYIREEGGEGTSSQEALYQYFSTWRVAPEMPAAGPGRAAVPGSAGARAPSVETAQEGLLRRLKKLFGS